MIRKADAMNIKQKIVVMIMDLLILAELATCMYFGMRDPEALTLFFLKTYVPLLLATILAGRLLIRRLSEENT